MFEVTIPKISDEEMKKRYAHIKPVITIDGKLHYLREFSFKELSTVSYIWNKDTDVRGEVNEGYFIIYMSLRICYTSKESCVNQ